MKANRSKRRAAAWMLALIPAAVGCGASATRESNPRPAESRVAPPTPLVIEVQGIAAAKFNPSTLGLAGEHIGIKVSNPSTADVALRGFRVAFEATREGVSFPCVEAKDANNREREPNVLRAGETFRFERDIPCTLSLPGRYTISVFTSFGESSKPVRTESFVMTLTGARENDPRPHPAVSGLYGAVIGNPFTRPLPRNSSTKYTAVVALVNGSSRAIEKLSASVVFRVYKVGQPLPCLESPVPLHVPEKLLPGATYTESVPVSCVLDALGDYDVVGSLEVGRDRKESADLGRYRLTISSDPMLFTPPP